MSYQGIETSHFGFKAINENNKKQKFDQAIETFRFGFYDLYIKKRIF